MDKVKTENKEQTENVNAENNTASEKETEESRGSFFKGEERRTRDRRQDRQQLNDKLDSMMSEVSEKDSELEKLQKEIDSLKDLMQRRQADFENYKKRSLKQFEDQKRFVIKDLALDVISVNDELLRAIDAAYTIPEGESLEGAHKSFVDGVSMISKMLEEGLKKYGVTEIDAQDQEFDPNYHEAVEIEPSADVSVDTVVKVYQKGFSIDELIIRSSKVKVAKAGKETAAAGKQDKTEDDEQNKESESA